MKNRFKIVHTKSAAAAAAEIKGQKVRKVPTTSQSALLILPTKSIGAEVDWDNHSSSSSKVNTVVCSFWWLCFKVTVKRRRHREKRYHTRTDCKRIAPLTISSKDCVAQTLTLSVIELAATKVDHCLPFFLFLSSLFFFLSDTQQVRKLRSENWDKINFALIFMRESKQADWIEQTCLIQVISQSVSSKFSVSDFFFISVYYYYLQPICTFFELEASRQEKGHKSAIN